MFYAQVVHVVTSRTNLYRQKCQAVVQRYQSAFRDCLNESSQPYPLSGCTKIVPNPIRSIPTFGLRFERR